MTITFLTDFGHRDPYVGIMKGVVLRIDPSAEIIDLTHGIPPQAISQGAFALGASWRYFPEGTIHLVVVDPGVGGARAPLVLDAGGHLFVGPDNGVLTPVLERQPDARAWKIDKPEYCLPRVSATFHGRDIFAPAAAWLSRGIRPDSFGPVWEAPVRLPWPEPLEAGGRVQGIVMYVDTFGNLVTNLAPGKLGARVGEGARLRVAGRVVPICKTYGDVSPGELVALEGSFEVLEVSINGGNAADLLGLTAGSRIWLEARG